MTNDDKPDEVIGAVYRGLPSEAPPPSIDGAVLAAARDKVALPRRRNWAVPVSLAAVLVLAVGVTLRMEGERPDVAKIQAPASAPVQSSQPKQLTPPLEPSPLSQSLPPSEARPSAPVAKPSEGAPAPPKAAKAPQRVERESLPRENRAKRAPAAPNDERAARRPVPSVASVPQAKSAKPAATATAPAAAGSSKAPVVNSPRTVAESAESPAATAAAPSALGASSAPPSAPPSSASAASADLKERPAAQVGQALATAKSETADSGLAANSQRAPDDWLERIAVMRTEGRHIEADVNVAEFRRIYPRFTISPSMQERIARPR